MVNVAKRRIADHMHQSRYDLIGVDFFKKNNSKSIDALALQVVQIYYSAGVSAPIDITEIFGDTINIDFDGSGYDKYGNVRKGDGRKNREVLQKVQQKAEEKARLLQKKKKDLQRIYFDRCTTLAEIEGIKEGSLRFSIEDKQAYLYYTKKGETSEQKLKVQRYYGEENVYTKIQLELSHEFYLYVRQEDGKIIFRDLESNGALKFKTKSKVGVIDRTLVSIGSHIVNPVNGTIERVDKLYYSFSLVLDSIPEDFSGTDHVFQELFKRQHVFLSKGDALYNLFFVQILGAERFLSTMGEKYFVRIKKELNTRFTTEKEKKEIIVSINHVLQSIKDIDFNAVVNKNGEFKNKEYEDGWNHIRKFFFRREKQLPGFTEWVQKKLREYKKELARKDS